VLVIICLLCHHFDSTEFVGVMADYFVHSVQICSFLWFPVIKLFSDVSLWQVCSFLWGHSTNLPQAYVAEELYHRKVNQSPEKTTKLVSDLKLVLAFL
jgi:hypothetical protein